MANYPQKKPGTDNDFDFQTSICCAQVRWLIPGPADKRLTGKGEKMTYSLAAGCNWLCLAGV